MTSTAIAPATSGTRKCPTPNILRALIGRARVLYGDVTPCAGRTWDDSITYHDGHLVFWFNDPDGSTRVIRL